jgi:peptidoglycan/xylan/chitin deacetylase (PgdA/CDA1 family)
LHAPAGWGILRGMRTPITMCHGLSEAGEKPLTEERFDALMRVAAELGFTSIDYDQLEAWQKRDAPLPERPVLFDFDHPVTGILGCRRIMDRYGFRGTLFINTGPMHDGFTGPGGSHADALSWDQLRELRDHGWHIGAHTVTHPNLSTLSLEDPTGERIARELDACNAEIEAEMGRRPVDFAFTGTSFSSVAQREVKKRYRYGRLWITRATYQVNGDTVRFAELVKCPGADEADGGPPMAARYIRRTSDPYLLPSMEFQALIYDPGAFRRYLSGAADPAGAELRA